MKKDITRATAFGIALYVVIIAYMADPYGVKFKLRIRRGSNPELLGTYPFVQRDGKAWGGRFGYFSEYQDKPLYQSHYA